MLHAQSPAARRLAAMGAQGPSRGYRNGGLVVGPGDESSDSIPARLSTGEFVLPSDTVREVGIKKLRDLVKQTHEPSGKARKPGHFADGGLVNDDLLRQQNNFGDAAAALKDPSIQQVQTPAPAQSNAVPAASANVPTPTAPAPVAATSPSSPASSVSQIPTDFDKVAPKPDGSMNDPLNSETGRNLQALANSVGGLGSALPKVASTGGAISSLINRTGSALQAIPATAVAATSAPSAAALVPSMEPTSTKDSSLGVDSTSGFGATQSMATPEGGDSARAASTTNWDRSGMSNAQVGQANPSGRVTLERLANGSMSFSGGNVSGPVSYADDRGNAIAGAGPRGDGFGGLQVAPAGSQVGFGANDSYVFSSDGTSSSSMAASNPGSRTNQAAGNAPAAASLDRDGARQSPVGMTVAEAQQRGLIGQATGYNPAFDQRLQGNANSAAPGSNSLPQFNSPQVNTSANDWETRNNLRNLEVSASSITNNGGRYDSRRGRVSGPSVAQSNFQDAAKADQVARAQQPAVDAATNRVNAELQREGIQQAGATQRESMRTDIDRGRLSLEQIAADERRRNNERLEKAQEAVMNAGTAEKQRAAQSRLLALMGKSENLKDRYVTVGGGTYVQDGQTVKEPTSIYDSTTQQWLRPPAATQQNTPPSKDKLVKGQVYNLPGGRSMRWNGSSFVAPN